MDPRETAQRSPPPVWPRLWVLTLSALCLLLWLGLVGVALVALGRALDFFREVVVPLALAGLLALMLRPVVAALQARLGWRREAAIALCYGVALAGLALVGVWLIPELVRQAWAFGTMVPQMLQQLARWAAPWWPQAEALLEWLDAASNWQAWGSKVATTVSDALPQLTHHLAEAGRGVLAWLSFMAALMLVPVYLFYFLRSDINLRARLHRELSFLPPRWRDDVLYLVWQFAHIMVAFFRGQLLIALITGAMLGAGFSLAGLKLGLLLGLGFGLLNIIPYLGTVLALAVVLPVAFLQAGGGIRLVVACLVIQSVVQLIESYWVTPRIMGKETGLHPVTIIVAILFWGKALSGVLGMLLAIPLTAFLITVWRVLRRHYLQDEAGI
ncbi:MAG: AI-2E family transporter [Polyangiales bacterium]